MKRTAAALMFLAGLGGCMTPDKKSETPIANRGMKPNSGPAQATGYVGPNGEPITKAAAFRGQAPGITQADGRNINPRDRAPPCAD